MCIYALVSGYMRGKRRETYPDGSELAVIRTVVVLDNVDVGPAVPMAGASRGGMGPTM